MADMPQKRFIFSQKDVDRKYYKDRWVKFAFGPQGFKNTENLNLGIVKFAENKVSLNHRHEVEEALYVLSGKARIKIAGKLHDLKRSDFVYIPVDTDHQVITGESSVKILFIFGGKVIIKH